MFALPQSPLCYKTLQVVRFRTDLLFTPFENVLTTQRSARSGELGASALLTFHGIFLGGDWFSNATREPVGQIPLFLAK